jgi:mRNA interferase HicA
MKRWLSKQGATFTPGKGGHLLVLLNGRRSVLPMHSKDILVAWSWTSRSNSA